MREPPRRAVCLAVLGATGLARPVAAQQPAWPTRPMRLIVPFPAGGTTDTLARILAERLGARLGQTVVVENRGGAAGVIAAELASRAEPDGYTLFLATIGTAAINPHLHTRLNYRPDDLVPVGLFAELPNVLVVRPDAPWPDLQAFLAEARSQPGRLTYASSGSGSSLHLSGEMLKADAGVDILHVPFRGGGDSVNQILGGRVDAGMNNLPTAIALIRAGQLRALAVTGPVRAAALPEVPTVAESGLPGYAATAWFGVQAPVRTPATVIARVNAEINAIVADPATRTRAEDLGARLRAASPDGFAEYIREEGERWAAVIRRSGAKVD